MKYVSMILPDDKDFFDLTPEEYAEAINAWEKEKRKVRKNKHYDDDTFDYEYDMAIQSLYFEADPKLGLYPFELFEEDLNLLNTYYQYSRRYVSRHIKTAKAQYSEMADEADSAEADLVLEDLMDNSERMRNLLYESIFLMLFAAFERLLKRIVADAANEHGKEKFVPQNSEEPTAYEYMDYLRWTLNIIVPVDLFTDFDMIRVLRNSLIHSKGSRKVDNYIKEDKHGIWNSHSDRYNARLIEFTFETFGMIADCIEAEYGRE